MERRGVFIVLEGADGSGKGTQFNLLAERLKAIGYDVAIFDFPRYDQGSSHFVKQYLNGVYGNAADITPYTASLFFALDRYEASQAIREALEAGKIVLSNRFTGSNMAHQGGKFSDEAEQRGFFVWADNLEFQLLGIPRPDINIFLRVPAETSFELIKRKNARSYTDKARDEHEADINHLKQSVATYDLLCRLFPKDFKAIECTKNGRLMEVTRINNLIWKTIKPLLPADRPNPAHGVVVSLGATETNPKIAPPSANGELVFPFKAASLLLRMQIERYLPGSTGSKLNSWAGVDYACFTPRSLTRQLANEYKASFRDLARLQEELREKLRRYLEKIAVTASRHSRRLPLDELLLPLMPLGALAAFHASLKKRDIEPLCGYLLTQDTAEAQWAGQQIYLAARQKWPRDFKNKLEPGSGLTPVSDIVAKLISGRLSDRNSASELVILLEARPRREFDLLADSIYPFSNISLGEIIEAVADWPYQQKYRSLQQAIALPGLLGKITYKMDLITDQITIRQLALTAGLKDIQIQLLTPRYGYEVPVIIDEAGLSDIYDSCFDASLKLYSLLQSADMEQSAPYATLMGHKNRCQLLISAESLSELIKTDNGSIKAAVEAIYEKASEVHPLLWEILGSKATVPHEANRARTSHNRVKPSRRRGGNPKKP